MTQPSLALGVAAISQGSLWHGLLYPDAEDTITQDSFTFCREAFCKEVPSWPGCNHFFGFDVEESAFWFWRDTNGIDSAWEVRKLANACSALVVFNLAFVGHGPVTCRCMFLCS